MSNGSPNDSSLPEKHFKVRQTSTLKSLLIPPARQRLLGDIIALYSCKPTRERVKLYTTDCFYDDQFVSANDRYKMTGQWFALPKLFKKSKNEGYQVINASRMIHCWFNLRMSRQVHWVVSRNFNIDPEYEWRQFLDTIRLRLFQEVYLNLPPLMRWYRYPLILQQQIRNFRKLNTAKTMRMERIIIVISHSKSGKLTRWRGIWTAMCASVRKWWEKRIPQECSKVQ